MEEALYDHDVDLRDVMELLKSEKAFPVDGLSKLMIPLLTIFVKNWS